MYYPGLIREQIANDEDSNYADMRKFEIEIQKNLSNHFYSQSQVSDEFIGSLFGFI